MAITFASIDRPRGHFLADGKQQLGSAGTDGTDGMTHQAMHWARGVRLDLLDGSEMTLKQTTAAIGK